jgi:hypothetical protein
MKRTIYLDMDGVMFDWQGKVLEILGLDKNEWTQILRKDEGALEKNLGKNKVWDAVNRCGIDFWENLELFPWSIDLYDLAKKYGEVLFLSSPGSSNVNPEGVAAACYGKIISVNKYFPNTQVILAKNKYHLAGKGKILVDDSSKKLEPFQEEGGEIYLWPNQWKLISGGVSIDETFKRLETKIEEMEFSHANL